MAGDEGRLREVEERYEGYTVYDQRGEKIGKVDELLVDDESGREEYVGVKMGLFGMSGTALVPMEISSVNESERSVAVAESRDRVRDAPTYGDDDEVTADFEERVRRHYGLEEPKQAAGSGAGTGAEQEALGPGSRRRVRRRVRTEETEELTEEEAAEEAAEDAEHRQEPL